MSNGNRKILILGGTKEASALAQKRVAEGHDVTTSLAGRTREPEPVAGKTRVGGFGGVQGLADYLNREKIDLLIDATHPFATQISANAKQAAQLAGVILEARQRPSWKQQVKDQWQLVPDLQTARDEIPSGARVLLALGSQHIAIFKDRTDVFFLIRRVDPPEEALPFKQHELLIGKPSANWQEEAEMLKSKTISHIVCRNSGGEGAYAKIEAARNLCLPVIMIEPTANKETR